MAKALSCESPPAAAREPAVCWLLVICDGGVPEIEVFATRQGAQRELYRYVRQRWSELFGEEPIDGDRERSIERYFDAGHARYMLEDRTLL